MKKRKKDEKEEPSFFTTYFWVILQGFKRIGYFVLFIALIVALAFKLLFGLIIAVPGVGLVVYCISIERDMLRHAVKENTRENGRVDKD